MLIFVVKPKDNLKKITTISNEAFLVLLVLTANFRFFVHGLGFEFGFFLTLYLKG